MSAARFRSIQPDAWPASSGTTTVSGATLWATGSDAHEVLVDDLGTLSVFLLDLAGDPEHAGPAADAVASALDLSLPLHVVVADLASVLRERRSHAAFGVLRFQPARGRVEILNAGLPPIACVQSDGKAVLTSPRSGPVGLLADDVHAYDLVPFAWNAQWVLMSDGVTGGSLARVAVSEVIEGLRTSGTFESLARSSSTAVGERLERLVGQPRIDDASLVVVHTDPSRSPSSGIR